MNRVTAFAKRRPGLSGTAAGIAVALVVFGGYAANACTCITPIIGTSTTTTTTPSGTLGGVSVANLWLTAPGDSAGSCQRSGTQLTYIGARSGGTGNLTCGGSQFLDQAVGQASPGDIIGVPGGKYVKGKQFINYKSGLQNESPACDPLGTWGSVNTTKCIRIAPAFQQQVFFDFQWEEHTSDIWLDGSSTGTVADQNARTYSFKSLSYYIEDDPGDAPPGVAINHIIFTGVWASGMSLSGCQFCRISQGEIGPRIHVEKAGSGDCANGGRTVDATDGTSWPVNPSDSTHLPNVGVPTGYIDPSGQIPSVFSRNGAHIQNDEVDHLFMYYANNVSDLACDPHDGGFYLQGGIDSLVLDSNIWRQNEGYAIQIQNVGDQPPNNGVTLQNNDFGQHISDMRSGLAGTAGCTNFVAPSGFCNGPTGDVDGSCGGAIQIDASVANWTIRYNSFTCDGIAFNYVGTPTFTGQVYGNTGGHPDTCTPSGSPTFAYNVWTSGSPCSGTDTTSTQAALYTNTSIVSLNTALKGATGSTAADDFVTNATYKPAGLGSIDDVTRSGNYDAGSWAR